jgi:hypothetical protein
MEGKGGGRYELPLPATNEINEMNFKHLEIDSQVLFDLHHIDLDHQVGPESLLNQLDASIHQAF